MSPAPSPFHSHLAPALGGQGKELPGRHRSSFLSAQALTLSSVVNSLWDSSLWDTRMLFPLFQRSIHMPLPDFLASNILILVILGSWPNSETICFCPEICVYPFFRSILPPYILNYQAYCSQLCPLEGLSFSTDFRATLDWGSSPF